MNILLHAMQATKHSTEPDASLQSYTPDKKQPSPDLQEKYNELVQANKFLEEKVARLTSKFTGIDQDFKLREKTCDEKISIINAAIQELIAIKNQTERYLDNALRDIQKCTGQYERLLDDYRQVLASVASYQTQIDVLQKQLEKAHQNERRFSLQLREFSKNPKISIPDSIQEEYQMSSNPMFVNPTSNNEPFVKPAVAQPTSPFGYVNFSNNLFTRGSQGPESTRIEKLEKQVASVSEELRTIKELLQHIAGIPSNATATPKPPQEDWEFVRKFLQSSK